MVIAVAIALFFAWFVVVEFVNDAYTNAKYRRDDQIVAAYRRQEAVRQHARNLADIERMRRATTEELIRVATEAQGGVLEGTAVEVRRP
jgi:cytidylate kinase